MSSEFSLFDNIVNDNHNTNNTFCEHLIDFKTKCCTSCGLQLDNDILYNNEHKSFNNNNRKFNNSSRCHIRKSDEKNIFKDVSSLNIPDNIIQEANTIYQTVVKNQIYRGNTRKAIIFACIFYAYKNMNKPQTCDALISLFNIERKDGLKGLKLVNINSDNVIISKTNYITPQNIIAEFMNNLSASKEDTDKVIELYTHIHKKSEIINRARPQSVASGLIRYYILKHGKNISMSDFIGIVKISELTINRMVKEISRILDS
jgi:transcription initiation factor TFIIIB Brf1 subunit/transcription initiation factor TFIIB